jgi:hypothetical protein
MVFGKSINQFFHQLYAFQVRDGIERRFFKQPKVVLNNVVAESMEGGNVDTVSIGTDKAQQAPAHGYGTRISIGKAKNIGRLRADVGQQYLTDAGTQDLCFCPVPGPAITITGPSI